MSHILRPLQVTLPELSPVEIRRATTGLIVDLENATSEYQQWANVQQVPLEKQNRIQFASRKIMRFIAEVTQLRDGNENQKHLSQLNLEHIPEDIFLAIIELSQEIPEIYNIFFRSPTDHHLFAVMFQKALCTVDKPIPLRHIRAAKILDLQQEIPEQTIDRTKPFPVQMETVTHEQISHGTLALHEILTQKLDDMPTELRLAMQHLIDFLIDCLNPDEEKPATKRYEQLMHWPQNFHLGEIPESVINAAACIKFFDATLHLAILGHDHAQTTVERDHITDHRTNRRRRELETPLAYNPMSIAMQNTEARRKDCLADITEMYAHGELSLLPAHMHSELSLVSAHQHTQIAAIMNGSNITLFSRGLFTRENLTRANLKNALANTVDRAAHAYRHVRTTPPKILFQQTLDFFSQLRENNRARIRRNEIEKWNETLDGYISGGWFFAPIGIVSINRIRMMLTSIEKEPKMLQPEIVRKIAQTFAMELENVDPTEAEKFKKHFAHFDGEALLEQEMSRVIHRGEEVRKLLTFLKETQKYIVDQYEQQIAFPGQLPSVKRLTYNDPHYAPREKSGSEKIRPINSQVIPGQYIAEWSEGEQTIQMPHYGIGSTRSNPYGAGYTPHQILIPRVEDLGKVDWSPRFNVILTKGNFLFDAYRATPESEEKRRKVDKTISTGFKEETGRSLQEMYDQVYESSDGTPILNAVKLVGGQIPTYVVRRQKSVQAIDNRGPALWRLKDDISNLNVMPEGHIFFLEGGRTLHCKFRDQETNTYKEHIIPMYLDKVIESTIKVIQLASNDGHKEFMIAELVMHEGYRPQINVRHIKFDGENMKRISEKGTILERHYSDIFPLPDGRVVAINGKGIKIFDFTKERPLGIARLFENDPETYLEQEFSFGNLHMIHYMLLNKKDREDYVATDLQVLPSGEIFFRLDGHTFYITEDPRKIHPQK